MPGADGEGGDHQCGGDGHGLSQGEGDGVEGGQDDADGGGEQGHAACAESQHRGDPGGVHVVGDEGGQHIHYAQLGADLDEGAHAALQ